MSQEEIIVPKGWELKKISDIGHIITGSTPKTSNSEFYGNDFPFYGPADLGSKIEIFESQKGLTQSGLDVSRVIPEDSILVQCIGDVGKSSIIKKMGACNQQINVIIPNLDTVIPKFVYYWINSSFFRNQMIQNATRTTLPILNKGKFSNLPFFLPQLSIQKQIVTKLDHILGELEVKKKEILSLIEQNKQRIDFFEKNWMSYVIDREIENHPKRKEWQIMALDKLCSKINDGVHKTPTYTKSGIPFISVRELQNDTINFQNCRYISESEHLELIKRCNPEYNDVLLSKTGNTIGKLAIVKESQKSSLFVNTALLKPLKNKIYSEFLLFSLKTFFNKKKNLSKIKTSAQPNLPINMIKKIEILLPSLLIQKQIIQNIKSAEEKFQSQKKQFENIKNNYESKINYINHIQSSVLDSAFSGKLLN